MTEDNDSLETLERKDTKTKLPLGWVLLAVGLILWGVYYLVAYTPQISGWTQVGAYEQSIQQK